VSPSLGFVILRGRSGARVTIAAGSAGGSVEGAGLPDFGGRGTPVGGTRGRVREVARISEIGDPFGDGWDETETSEGLPGGNEALNGRIPTPAPPGDLKMGLAVGEVRPGEAGRSPVGVRTPWVVLTNLVVGFGDVARSPLEAFPDVASKVALRAAVNAAPGAGCTPLGAGDASARRWLGNLRGVISGEVDGIRRCGALAVAW